MSRSRAAVTVAFALNGVLFASIFSRLPAIQDRTGTSDGELGLALLCSMLGLLCPSSARAPSWPAGAAGRWCWSARSATRRR